MFGLGVTFKQTAIFLFVGGATFFLYYGLFEVARHSFSDGIALTIAYVIAVSFNFVANRSVTFGQNGREVTPILHSLGRFGVVAVLNYLVSTGVTLSALSAGVPAFVAVSLGIVDNDVREFSPQQVLGVSARSNLLTHP